MNQFMTTAISSSPHVRSKDSTQTIMRDVLIALTPAVLAGCWFFGIRALCLAVYSALACMFFEWLYEKLMKRDCTVRDLSAAVTGVLIAMVCPVGIPYWALVIGDAFAIILVKQLFGGIGKNFMNPALAARAFMLSWPALMTTWAAVGSRTSPFQSTQEALDAVSSATPLAAMHGGVLPANSILDAFLGNVGGSMGETSALLLILGGCYLVARKVIKPRIPLTFIGTVALLTLVFPKGHAGAVVWMAHQVCSGGLMLGAIFMATDYVTSPMTCAGQYIYAIGCGLLTVFIRYFGSYPEGVSYAILVMNACAGLLDRVGIPKRFGEVKVKGGAEKK